MPWELDLAHTRLIFSARHMMISRVQGEFERFTGSVNFDPDNPTATTIDITVETASVNSNFEDRDNHLRSPEFFDVKNYPHMTFKSKRVEQLDENNARLTGDLTIRNITNEITLDVTYYGMMIDPWGKTVAGFSASTKIDREDWGLIWNMNLEGGGLLTGEEITLNIEAELVKQD